MRLPMVSLLCIFWIHVGIAIDPGGIVRRMEIRPDGSVVDEDIDVTTNDADAVQRVQIRPDGSAVDEKVDVTANDMATPSDGTVVLQSGENDVTDVSGREVGADSKFWGRRRRRTRRRRTRRRRTRRRRRSPTPGCRKETGGTCAIWPCDRSRNAKCVESKCLCDTRKLCYSRSMCREVVPSLDLTPAVLNTPLRKWPFLEAHNSATGFAREDDTCSILHQKNNWAVNQPKGSVSTQLDCGARALDIRGQVINGELRFHHGDVMFQRITFAQLLREVKSWAKSNPTELIMLNVANCHGDNCMDKMKADLSAAGIPYVYNTTDNRCHDPTDGGNAESLTYGQALEKYKVSGGGSVLAAWRCYDNTYDVNVKCFASSHSLQEIHSAAQANSSFKRVVEAVEAHHGSINVTVLHQILDSMGNETMLEESSAVIAQKIDKQVLKEAVAHKLSFFRNCLLGGSPTYNAFKVMWDYVNRTTQSFHDTRIKRVTAHWQYDTESIVSAAIYAKCITQVMTDSDMNRHIADKFSSGHFYQHVNMLSLDDICLGGPRILNTLREKRGLTR